MLRHKIFCTFLWFTLPALILISLGAFLMGHLIRNHDKADSLEQFATVLSTVVNNEGIGILDSLQHLDDDMRITIIEKQGKVLFDSERNPSSLENHLQRLEVIQALRLGHGSSQRYSETLEKQTYYYAVKLNDGNILRISFVSETLLTYTLRITAYFWVLLIILVLACALIARRLSKYLMEPFNHIDLNHPQSVATYDELKPFLKRIFEQQNKIDEQFAELARKNNELQVIIKSMSDGLVLLNAQGTILTINKIARKIFGVTKENCLNQNYLSIDHSQYMQDLMANQAQKPKQTMQITKDDRDYEIRFNRIEDEHKCLGFAMMILDVTEKVRAEQMRQEFTANVSHELKTPLQSIIGYSELMANGIVRSDDIKSFAERIYHQSTRLQNLIEDIIFLSSLDEGTTALTEVVSISQITREVFDNLAEKAQQNSISLQLVGKDLTFEAVNRYIYELIYNLVDNAIRYNKPHGSVTVSLEESSNKYQIEVTDTGIGVSPSEQYRIFERFYRVDKSHSRNTGGTGLGLSIVKRVVLFHQGKIKIQSTLGVGTSFLITFNKIKLEQVIAEAKLKQQQMFQESLQAPASAEGGVIIGSQSDNADAMALPAVTDITATATTEAAVASPALLANTSLASDSVSGTASTSDSGSTLAPVEDMASSTISNADVDSAQAADSTLAQAEDSTQTQAADSAATEDLELDPSQTVKPDSQLNAQPNQEANPQTSPETQDHSNTPTPNQEGSAELNSAHTETLTETDPQEGLKEPAAQEAVSQPSSVINEDLHGSQDNSSDLAAPLNSKSNQDILSSLESTSSAKPNARSGRTRTTKSNTQQVKSEQDQPATKAPKASKATKAKKSSSTPTKRSRTRKTSDAESAKASTAKPNQTKAKVKASAKKSGS